MMENLNQLGNILQHSISPVVLISGIGMILLTLTNRYARTIDRTRVLKKEIIAASAREKETIIKEINILYKRSRILLWSIVSAVTSVLFVCLLITVLFADFFLQMNLAILGIICFVISLLTLVISILLFIKDMTLSLQALTLDIEYHID